MDEQVKEETELEKFCVCNACRGTGFTNNLRCAAIIKSKNGRKSYQCNMPSKLDSLYCGVHRNHKQ